MARSNINIADEKALVVAKAKIIMYTGPGGFQGSTYEDVKQHLSKYAVYPNVMYYALANKIKQIDDIDGQKERS